MEQLSPDLRMYQRPNENRQNCEKSHPHEFAVRSYIDSGPAKGLEGSRYGKLDTGDLTAIMAEAVD